MEAVAWPPGGSERKVSRELERMLGELEGSVGPSISKNLHI